MMRIISGSLRRRRLNFPLAAHVRPTRDMVRKAVFDVLGHDCRDACVLDLFSGSGAFGFEAISCGAREVVFIDHSAPCIAVINENARQLGVMDRCCVMKCDVFDACAALQRQGKRFAYVFADPPYHEALAKKCLLELGRYDIVQPLTTVIIEHYKHDELPAECGKFTRWQFKKYGDTFVSFYAASISAP